MDPLTASLMSSANALSQLQFSQQVGYAVLRKAMDVDAASAAALIQAIPQPPPASGALGGLFDAYA